MRVSALRDVVEHHCHEDAEVVSQEGRKGECKIVLGLCEELYHPN